MVTAEEELSKKDILLKDNELSLKFFALQFFEKVSDSSSVQQHSVAYTFVRSFVCSFIRSFFILSFARCLFICLFPSTTVYTFFILSLTCVYISKCI